MGAKLFCPKRLQWRSAVLSSRVKVFDIAAGRERGNGPSGTWAHLQAEVWDWSETEGLRPKMVLKVAVKAICD